MTSERKPCGPTAFGGGGGGVPLPLQHTGGLLTPSLRKRVFRKTYLVQSEFEFCKLAKACIFYIII